MSIFSSAIELPHSKFFIPNEKFFNYMERYKKYLIYDVGAGVGHISKSLLEKKHKISAIDLFPREDPEFEIYIGDGTTIEYLKNSIIMLCRPCHGFFVKNVIRRAIECKVNRLVYVGLQKNVDYDLGWDYDFILDAVNVGEENEEIWSLKVNH